MRLLHWQGREVGFKIGVLHSLDLVSSRSYSAIVMPLQNREFVTATDEETQSYNDYWNEAGGDQDGPGYKSDSAEPRKI